ncbi:flavo protein monooxygenase [Mollisia scopiformis]|uniref:Flavo protein monooxygenase n=1 Tax=Mollisia scopiformis TaxID=149040 RepID=A0A194X9X9_MOLSC|nr:flavo protein monooxygenase [Mollisia scopiformis]KUJ16973.1 flavo protein monooxygenase [Mollisia scopiformis]
MNTLKNQIKMSTPTNLKVLISGAGIAGPCLAHWLSRTHLSPSITIVERSPSPRLTGQSIDIRGPAIDIVKRMGLEDAVRERHTTEEGTRMVRSDGRSFAQFETGETFTAEYEILRADLSQLFLEATQRLGNVKYVYEDSVQALEQGEKGVDVTFNGGSKERFDLVVAADGSTSPTRSMILDEHVLRDSYNFLGQYIAFFSIPSQANDTKMWHWYNIPKGLAIMTRPHRTSKTIGAYLCITTSARGKRDQVVEEALDSGTEETKEMLHSYFENTGWEAKRVLDGMDTADDFYMSRAAQVKLPKWTNGRAVLLGDAAHATFGVGTSLAIEGAYLLAGELGKIESSEDVPRALEKFEGVFRELYKTMEDLPPGFPQLAFPQTAWGLWVRDTLLWFVSKTKLYKLLKEDSGMDWKMPRYDWRDV